MRQETINLYKFEELKEDIKQKVIEKYRDINVEYQEWYDGVFEDWYLKLKKLGYEDTKIYFSGFGSQGDGACFIAKVNIEGYLSAHKLKTKFKKLLECADNISITITHNWRYYFASSTDVNFEYFEDDEKVESLLNQLETVIRSERETLGKEIYNNLDEEYYGLISDEAVKQAIQGNDYEFMNDGREFKKVCKGK